MNQLIERLQEEGKTTVIVLADNSIIGVIAILDTPKSGAKEAIYALKRLGIESIMLTGKYSKGNRTTSWNRKNFCKYSPIWKGGCSKTASQQQQQQKEQGQSNKDKIKKVAMIGDGINDALALTSSDVGIAIGSGTDIAIEAGDVVLIRDDIRDVVTAIEIARKTVSKIKQNLIYAFAYNVILIPIGSNRNTLSCFCRCSNGGQLSFSNYEFACS